jgi:hypothetical protein
MTSENPKSTVDDDRHATRASNVDDELGAPRTPWRWAAATIILLAAAAETAYFVGRAGGSDAQRRRTIEALSPAEQAALAAKYERFQKLESDEQERLRKLHQAIEADADPESLRGTLARYETWIAQLPPQVSAQLVGLPAAERANKVAAIEAERKEEAARIFGEADARVLVAWLEKQVREHQDAMMGQLPESMRERLDHMGPRERTWALMLTALSTRGPGGSPFQKLSPAALAELKAGLSQAAQAQWNGAAGNPDELKSMLANWVRQTMERTMAQGGPSTRISDAQLMEFFDRDLSEDDRARLVALPREEMMSQLRREYYRRKGLWREGYWRNDGRRPGGDDRMQGGPGDGGPGGSRPFGRGPGSFGPRPGGGFGPGQGGLGPGGPNPGGTNPGGPNPRRPDQGPPRPNDGGKPPPKPQT